MANSQSNPERIEALYRLRIPAGKAAPAQREAAEKIARFIAYEQTVELPEALIRDPYIREHIVGRVESVQATDEDSYLAKISYSPELASGQLSQLVNLLYGNVSMLDGVRLQDAAFPDALISQFAGPSHGIAGIRRLLGVYRRPLLATAVKPRGTAVEGLAKIAADFALGGGDIVKDDQNLVADDFESFKTRVDTVARAVADANMKTGRNCLYFPHIAAKHEALERYAEFVHRSGLKGALLCPMVMGLDTARKIAADFNLVFMAHPALTGAYTSGREHGISHAVLLGSLFRLAGADISVFPATGGRFNYAPEDCAAVSARLKEPMAHLHSSFPCPAGGITFDRVPELTQAYGEESILLIGGSLQAYSSDIAAGTRAYQSRIAQFFQAEQQAPQAELASSCELPDSAADSIQRVLRFSPDFSWDGRSTQVYKASDSAGEPHFAGVKRVELIGKFGERADFNLRYFEIEPGGFTSLEKHLHTHVVIAARGRGTIQVNGSELDLAPNDIAYIAPLEPHQIRNSSSAAFGFYCIVDHERDRPMVLR
jgi:ribulose-bisphosphate carboxylase large chain